MHLHPLIHTELVHQHELELSRRTLRAPLSSDRARRSLPSKKTAASIATLTIAIFATLALTTGAYAATGKKAPHGKSAKSALRASHAKPHHGSVRVVSPRIIYLYFPGPPQPPVISGADSSEDCANYQVNCTDEQNCQFWGVNCDRITNPISESQAANQDNSTGDGSATQADGASADPASDSIASSDSSSIQSSADTAANLADTSLYEDC